MQIHLHAKEIWRHRGFILASVLREFHLRYRGSILGATWLLIPPITMILVYTLVFSNVMHSRLPGNDTPFAYSIYLCSGLLLWNLFTEITQRCQSIFIDNAGLLKKTRFTRLALPAIVVISGSINWAIITALFVLFLAASSQLSIAGLFALLIGWLLTTAIAGSLGYALSFLFVFFRDLGPFLGTGLQLLFWCTPIVYPATVLPEWALPVVRANPFFHIAGFTQRALLEMKLPPLSELTAPCLWILALAMLATLIHRRLQFEILDEL